jgi:hypothetical protein
MRGSIFLLQGDSKLVKMQEALLQGGPVPASAAQREEFTGHGIFVAGQAFSLHGSLQVQTPDAAARFKWMAGLPERI